MDFSIGSCLGKIYCFTCRVNGKRYVGQTWKENVVGFDNGSRYGLLGQHANGAFGRAIKKHGHENFDVDIICELGTQEKLDFFEAFWIWGLSSLVSEWGYNLREGGTGGRHSLETRQKISQARKGGSSWIKGKK